MAPEIPLLPWSVSVEFASSQKALSPVGSRPSVQWDLLGQSQAPGTGDVFPGGQ